MYILKLYKELVTWNKIKRIAKGAQEKLLEKGFRVDWVGRIYTVINLPEEVVNTPISQEGYVLMQLREHDKLFLDMGIADYVSPEFNPIPETDSFLLVLSADRDYFRFWPLIKSLGKTTLYLVILRLLYVVLSSYNEKILELWNKMINLLF
tara:strand:- start:9 stop:461 length:453 start_codon:yes stop_codon:yes gene_type:complete